MSLTIRYENVAGTLSSIGSNVVRLGGLALTQSADLGEMATSELDWDDPDGTWTLTGYRVFTMSESAAPSNNQQVYRGRLNSRTYKRGPSMRTGTGRRITVELMDQNVLLGWRVMKDADANRPAETAGDRIRWLVNTRRAPVFAHPTYFANPTTAMDAADYRNQRYNDVLADIANVSGYNFWADYDEGRQRTELFFIDPESTDYSSTLQISNQLADVDSVITFAPSEDAELIVDPSRVAASVLGVYDGGDVYTTRDSTGNTFAYVDQTYELSNIKSEAKARALNTRYLDDNDEEDKHVTCSIIVPAASVNKVLHGQRILATFTHLANEGLGSATWYRITKRTVIQEEEIGLDYYRIALDLSPQGVADQTVTTTTFAAILGGADNAGQPYFRFTGDVPPGGWFLEPLVGPIEIVQSGSPFTSIRALSAMTVRIELQIDNAAVLPVGQGGTLSLLVNGVAIGTETQFTPGGFWALRWNINVNNYLLNAGDIVSFSYSGNDPGWEDSGSNETYLRVGRGTFFTGSSTWVGP